MSNNNKKKKNMYCILKNLYKQKHKIKSKFKKKETFFSALRTIRHQKNL